MGRAIKIDDSNKIVVDSFLNDEGEKFLNVRKFWKKDENADWIPTRQGMSVHVDNAPRLIKALRLALANVDEEARTLEPRDNKGKSKSKDEESAKKKSKDKVAKKRRQSEDDDE
jgi:hypothetical protein